MRVTLGYQWEGHEPDSTIEVDDRTGRRLLRDGKARPADGDAEAVAVNADPRVDVLPDWGDDDGVTVADVKAHAQKHGISTTEAKNQIRSARAATTENDKEA